jgi:hypothetical protein
MRKAKIIAQRRLLKVKSHNMQKWLTKLGEKRQQMENLRMAFEFYQNSEKLFAKVVFGQIRNVLKKERKIVDKFVSQKNLHKVR